MKHYIVTGGAGFIGSHLIDRLLAEGAKVTCVDNFDSFYSRETKCENLTKARNSQNFVMLEGDICDLRLWESIEHTHFDQIVHLAAKAGVRPSIEDPVGYYQTNVQGTLNVVEFARKSGIKKIVFASSSSVYGNCKSVPFTEDSLDLVPISPYASTKLAGEHIGSVYSHLHGIDFIGLRFFTVYGPRQRPDLAIHKFAKMIKAGDEIPFFGDGTTSRDYTYIDDIIDGITRAMNYDGESYAIFNLGNDRSVSLDVLLRTIEKELGCDARLNRLPMQPGDVTLTRACVKKSGESLGYAPLTSFDEGIAKFVAWLRNKT